MNKLVKCIVCIILVVGVFLTSTISTYALESEVYLSELRLIYAEDYIEAKDILKNSDFKDYKVFRENLNEDSDEIGVWLAYDTTTNIEDAITDISIMQMNGGYNEGNYREMIKQSYEEYLDMGEFYLQAINYFVKAYDANHFLAKSAYRQLNFYTVETDEKLGIEIPDFEGKLLGDIFYGGVDEAELATMFMEGNTYALRNIRSLLSMGVSYNEDGKTYLDKVQEAATQMNADASVFANKGYDELAALIAPTIETFREMFEELSAYESELNYDDEEDTDIEIKYMEYQAIASMTSNVSYLNGKTLYQFCLEYEDNGEYSNLYPLVAALNEGQCALTKLAQYYDVVRYSMSDYPEEMITEELDALEKTYRENPFNIYSGVDRSIYNDTFAFTNEAYRADVYNEADYFDTFFGDDQILSATLNAATGAVGSGLLVWAVYRHTGEYAAAKPAYIKARVAELVAKARSAHMMNRIGAQGVTAGKYELTLAIGGKSYSFVTYEDYLNGIIANTKLSLKSLPANPTFADKYYMVTEAIRNKTITLDKMNMKPMKQLIEKVNADTYGLQTGKETAETATKAAAMKASGFTVALYIVGGAMMLYSAISLGLTIYNYYNPDYEDIPIAMVDIINTDNGDRYIKYDVVYEVEAKEDGEYTAGDLNAFEGQRWNALYYTKSYEAGKPLLADEFYISNTNNKPRANYAPVHRFGEVVCYDLNKYNYDGDTSIYLSVNQSEKDKSAISNIPELVGSIFSTGVLILSGGIGTIIGIIGTLGTQKVLKKKREEE